MSVIATATNTVIATIPVGAEPLGVAVTPDGSKVYVANSHNSVSVIDTATNTVTATITASAYCLLPSPFSPYWPYRRVRLPRPPPVSPTAG